MKVNNQSDCNQNHNPIGLMDKLEQTVSEIVKKKDDTVRRYYTVKLKEMNEKLIGKRKKGLFGFIDKKLGWLFG